MEDLEDKGEGTELVDELGGVAGIPALTGEFGRECEAGRFVTICGCLKSISDRGLSFCIEDGLVA